MQSLDSLQWCHITFIYFRVSTCYWGASARASSERATSGMSAQADAMFVSVNTTAKAAMTAIPTRVFLLCCLCIPIFHHLAVTKIKFLNWEFACKKQVASLPPHIIPKGGIMAQMHNVISVC